MSIEIPTEFHGIVDEIVRFTRLPRPDVEHRVWMEAVDLGWNVARDVARFSVRPHENSDEMLRLYREGDGFIFETLVFWARPDRQLWSGHALDRLRRYASRAGLLPHEMKVLMLGDGTGNDTLYLAKNGFGLDYFDVPGSKTFDFAIKRFDYHGVLDRCVNVLPDYDSCLTGAYDAVISFEVLEHLPDPTLAIRDMGSMLKIGGIALVTESFEHVFSRLPTHLKTNRRYAGRTPFLFQDNGMSLSWYSETPLFRPTEFTRTKDLSVGASAKLLLDGKVAKAWLKARMRNLKRPIEGLT